MTRGTSGNRRTGGQPADSSQARAKEPASLIAGSYGHPIHPILVTLPIGMWVASLVFDVISKSADDADNAAAFAKGAYWLIGLAIIAAILSALFGLLDFTRLQRGTRAWTTAVTHMLLNTVVIVLFAVSWFSRRSKDGFPETSTTLLVLSVIALALLGTSGFLGGTLSYRYGVRVADEATQADGFQPTTKTR